MVLFGDEEEGRAAKVRASLADGIAAIFAAGANEEAAYRSAVAAIPSAGRDEPRAAWWRRLLAIMDVFGVEPRFETPIDYISEANSRLAAWDAFAEWCSVSYPH